MRWCCFSVLMWVGVGCAAEDPPAEPAPQPDAEMGAQAVPGVVAAGTPLRFPCKASSLSIMPSGGFEALMGRHVGLRAGSYQWRCMGSPAEGDVTVEAGAFDQIAWGELPSVVSVGRSVEVEVRSSDAYGNLGEERLEVAVEPAEAAVWEEERLRFMKSGSVTLWAMRGGERAQRRRLYVDAGAPYVEILAPERGTIFDSEASPEVTVRGRVEEDGPWLEVEINGEPTPLGPNGQFSYTLRPKRAGLHIIRYRARDVAGNNVTGSRAFLFGALREPFAGCSRALRVHLPAELLDDNAQDVDDLARIAELLMAGMVVPERTVDLGCDGEVLLKSVTWKPGAFDVLPGGGKLKLRMVLRDLLVTATGEACVCVMDARAACYETGGYMSTDEVEVEVDLAVGRDDPTALEVQDARIVMTPLTIRLEAMWGGLDWAVELFEDDIRAGIAAGLRDAVASRLQANLADLLSGLVPKIGLDIPAPLDERLEMDLRLSSVVSMARGLTVELDATVLKGATRASAPSALFTVQACGLPPPMPEGMVGLAFSLDLLNDALFTMFHRGALSDVSFQMSDGRPIQVGASLPPVVMPAPERGQVRLSVGDLRVSVGSLLGSMDLYASVMIYASLSYDASADEIVLTFLEDDLEIVFEPASKEDAMIFASSIDDLEAFVRDLVVDRLVSQQVRLKVPLLDLSRFSNVPGLAGVVLALEDAELTVTRSGYVRATGRIKRR